MTANVLSFLDLVSTNLSRNAQHPVAQEGARRLAAAHATVQPCQPSTIGAVQTLDALPNHELTDAVRQLAPTLAWIPSPRVDDAGANVGLVLLREFVTLDGLEAGITLVGPHGEYPEHDHPPAEVYLVLGGTADWRFGGSDETRSIGTGGVVHNSPHDRHVIRTADQPTVAIWFLWNP